MSCIESSNTTPLFMNPVIDGLKFKASSTVNIKLLSSYFEIEEQGVLFMSILS